MAGGPVHGNGDGRGRAGVAGMGRGGRAEEEVCGAGARSGEFRAQRERACALSERGGVGASEGAVGCGWPPDGDVAVDGAVCCRAGFVAGGRCRLVVAGNGRGGDGSPDALQDYGGRNGRAFDDGRR